jgi:adenosylcobinamide-GDP ribazoletransferase
MWRDVAGAFSFLTAIPAHADPRERKPGWIFSYFPLVGLLIGGILFLGADLRAFPHDLNAFMLLFIWVALTGGLHLDGFADSCDGLLATTTPERRLEIMKDPRAGSWAVVGLIILLLGKWLALREISGMMLILAPVMGRWAMVLAASIFPYARGTSGVGGHYRQGLGRVQVTIASIVALGTGAAYGWPVALVMILPLAVTGIIGRWASPRLGGGLTGDVYGAICEVTELVVLLTLGRLA